MTQRHIHFICTGNTCRSPMAEGILRHRLLQSDMAEKWTVSSSGLCAFPGDPATPFALQVLADMGIDISSHRSSRTTPYSVEEARYVLVMTRGHRTRLLKRFPDQEEKILLISDVLHLTSGSFDGSSRSDPIVPVLQEIPDPYGGTLEDYRQVADVIDYYVVRWLGFLQGQSS